MDPLSVISYLVTNTLLPKFLERGGEKVGEKLSDIVFEQSDKTIQIIRKVILEKLQTSGKDVLLKQAEENPIDDKISILKKELINQIKQDNEFENQLKKLVQGIQYQSLSKQFILSETKIQGNVKIGKIKQISKDIVTEQFVGNNLEVGSDFSIDDVTQLHS